jgi:hypothetical protein
MGNILFQNSPKPKGNPILDQLAQIRQAGPSNAVFNQMYQTNPQFRQFADSMRGKTPEQAFRENGLDFNQFKNYKW